MAHQDPEAQEDAAAQSSLEEGPIDEQEFDPDHSDDDPEPRSTEDDAGAGMFKQTTTD